jgi:hypothetical protein
MYTRRVVLFDGSSGNSSTYTSSDVLVADYTTQSVHWPGGGNATLTLQGSDDDGLRSSIVSRSDMTAITAAGIYDITPGVRWIRAVRTSADSLAVVSLQFRSD